MVHSNEITRVYPKKARVGIDGHELSTRNCDNAKEEVMGEPRCLVGGGGGVRIN